MDARQQNYQQNRSRTILLQAKIIKKLAKEDDLLNN